MSLNKENLKDDIYQDLGKIDTVIVENSSTYKEEVPSDYVYNVSPYKVTNNDASAASDADRGNIKEPQNKEDIDITSVAADSDPDVLVATQSDDSAANATELLVKQLREERRATVLADRIIQHLLDNLETEKAADNIVLLRSMTSFLTERVLSINEMVNTLANQTSVLSQQLISMSSNVQSLTTHMTTILNSLQSTVGVLGSTPAFNAAVSSAGVVTGLPIINSNVSAISAAVTSATIDSDSTNIKVATDQIEADLKEGGYVDNLNSITYDTSKNIK